MTIFKLHILNRHRTLCGKGHLVTSFGLSLLKPVYRTMDELIAAGTVRIVCNEK